MKHSRFVMTMALLIGVMGCSVKESMDTTDEPFQVVFEATPFLDGDAGVDTKTYVTPNGNYSSYEFYWSAQDTVGIFPSEGKQMAFSMANGAGASSATFDGGAWTCKVGYTYSSYFPFIGNYYLDPKAIPVSFKGMKQVGNANSDHFQKYDYMYAPATTKEGNFLNFSYKHLIAAVLPYVELPAGHYTGLTLSLLEPLFVTEGYYDLTTATPAIVGTEFSKTLHLDLDVTFADTETLVAYVPIAPMNMTGRTLTISITNEEGFVYRYTYTPGKAYTASNIYRLRSANSLVNYASQNIFFEDDNFKAYLVAHYDTNGDGEISHAEAGVIETISVYDGISSLQGIEYMPKLRYLSCSTLGLESLDVSNNTALEYLYCNSNQLTSLDVSNNTALEYLYCHSNQLTSLDVSNNTALEYLNCGDNQLTILDVLNNRVLRAIDCVRNHLSSLDVNSLMALETLYCDDNEIATLDFGNCPALRVLHCARNRFDTFFPFFNSGDRIGPVQDLDVSGNTELEQLECDYFELRSLNVSGCTALKTLSSNHGYLSSLDVSTCSSLETLFWGNNLCEWSLDVSGLTSLRNLMCINSTITSFNASGCSSLFILNLSQNRLTSLDITECTALGILSCQSNRLTSLDVSNNTALVSLFCGDNLLTSLDVSHNTKLTSLTCVPMPSLTTLFIYNGQAIPGVTTNRSEENIPSGTLIAIAP